MASIANRYEVRATKALNANSMTGNAIIGAGRNGVITDRRAVGRTVAAGKHGSAATRHTEENLIGESGESAISVGGEPETTNEDLRELRVQEIGGPFIQLREHSDRPPDE